MPALWRIKSDDYSNRAKKAEAYDILLQKYREHFTSATLEDLKKKIIYKQIFAMNFEKWTKVANQVPELKTCASHGRGSWRL